MVHFVFEICQSFWRLFADPINIEKDRRGGAERDGEGAVIHARSKDSVLARPALAVQRITDVGYIGNIISLLRAQTTSVSQR